MTEREVLNAKQRQYYASSQHYRDYIKNYMKAWRAAHPDVQARYSKTYYAKHREEVLGKQKERKK